MEYSLLSRCSLQSETDQTDYLKMAAIACNCMTAVTPEQAAIWSYPLADGSEEETIFNMVNAMLFRIHQSGRLAALSPSRRRFVWEGIRYHMQICNDLKEGLPFWPLELATMSSPFCCAGVDCGGKQYLSVWNIESEADVCIPVDADVFLARCAYPLAPETPVQYDAARHMLVLHMAAKTARVLELLKKAAATQGVM